MLTKYGKGYRCIISIRPSTGVCSSPIRAVSTCGEFYHSSSVSELTDVEPYCLIVKQRGAASDNGTRIIHSDCSEAQSSRALFCYIFRKHKRVNADLVMSGRRE